MIKQNLEGKFVDLEDCLNKAKHMLSSLEENYDLQKANTDMPYLFVKSSVALNLS